MSATSGYAGRPWLATYPPGLPHGMAAESSDMLTVFRAAVVSVPESQAVAFFDGGLTFRELDQRSDALASALLAQGFAAGDRLALFVQNDPAFLVGLVATWKAGGIAVCINPMNKERELRYQLVDSGATVLLCLDELVDPVVVPAIADGATVVSLVLHCSAHDDQTRDDLRVLPGRVATPSLGTPLADLLSAYSGESPPHHEPTPADVAVLTYTSGTTGEPKGAMNTHGGLAFNAQTYRDWVGLVDGDSVLGVAPLFHITGLVAGVCLAMLLRGPLVLCHRFEPSVVLDAIREHRPRFTVAAVTVFISLLSLPGTRREDWECFRAIYSGGAPVAPAVYDRFLAATERPLHIVYGLTETTSPSHMVPVGVRPPVDPVSGAMSVGLPTFEVESRILGDDGSELPAGEIGEIAISGPQVVPGYWGRPGVTAETLPGGELRTGDVGFMDADGWFYVVDRRKDLINASGYKVWPREVEDVLLSHPAVRQVCVVGVPDDYRGETVKAFVCLTAPGAASDAELIVWCRERMAAYKYPREVEFLDELPTTATGKILRRVLRDQNGA